MSTVMGEQCEQNETLLELYYNVSVKCSFPGQGFMFCFVFTSMVRYKWPKVKRAVMER